MIKNQNTYEVGSEQQGGIKNISKALLQAQKAMGSVSKNGVNPFYHSKYATLTDVIKVVKDICNTVGIVILQPIDKDCVETILIHADSGEFVSSQTNIIVSREDDPQAYGSAVTYARRYGLQSFLLIPADDDDAEGAVDRSKPNKTVNNNMVSSTSETVCGLHSVKMVNHIINGKDKIYFHLNAEKTARCSGKGFVLINPPFASINAERTGR